MKAIKLASNKLERERLKKKCMKVLAKAEDIKILKTWPSPEEDSGETKKVDQELKAPLSTRLLSASEELILLRGSQLNGANFPPWQSNPKPEVFESNGVEDLYT